jgi:hypothetical protein
VDLFSVMGCTSVCFVCCSRSMGPKLSSLALCSGFVFPGHTRQGLKCRVCKLNVHVDCQDKVGRCQPKSRLLRRQKSTSEIETRIQEPVPDEESKYIFSHLQNSHLTEQNPRLHRFWGEKKIPTFYGKPWVFFF